MSVSIQVAVRTRPFVPPDKEGTEVFLGIEHLQKAAKDGEVNIHHCDYSKNRFGFTWSWWTAYNWKKYLKDNTDIQMASNMKVVSQKDVYDACGTEIKELVKQGKQQFNHLYWCGC